MPFPASAGVNGLNGRTLCISPRHAFGCVQVLWKGIESLLSSNLSLSPSTRDWDVHLRRALVLSGPASERSRYVSFAGGDPHRRRGSTQPQGRTPGRNHEPTRKKGRVEPGTPRMRTISLFPGGGETNAAPPPPGRTEPSRVEDEILTTLNTLDRECDRGLFLSKENVRNRRR